MFCWYSPTRLHGAITQVTTIHKYFSDRAQHNTLHTSYLHKTVLKKKWRNKGIIYCKLRTIQLRQLCWWNANKNPTRCNSKHIFIYCKVTLHVSDVATPIIRSTKTVTAASGTGHNIGTATSLQRGPIGQRWREVAVPILWPVPEAAVTVFSTPDDGCCDTRNM
jgi:hypothetical protein